MVGDDVEASVPVDQFDDGHGADQEEEDFARIAELLDQLRADLGVVAQQTQYRPERTAHQQGDRGLVDA